MMQTLDTVLAVSIALPLAFISCPSLGRLPLLWLAHRGGAPVYDRAHYWAGVGIHIVCVVIFAFLSIVIWRTQLCRGCTSGLLMMMIFAVSCMFFWLLYSLATYLISTSRERPR
ncbi:MAG: hypothetical protein EPN74_10585 [Rhodanobacter sp.]|nr:MAG: hypothetical protein EPN74_10585 [Rhodanobacter sp.]